MRMVGMFLAALGTFLGVSNIAAAATIEVINQSKFPVTIGYSVCKPEDVVCWGGWQTINAKQSSDNLRRFPLSPKDTFEIVTAVENDLDGKVVAEMNSSCLLPAGTERVYLYDYDTNRIVCYVS